MIRNKKVIVVLPTYNAEHPLKNTYQEIPLDMVDEVILVDDASSDKTVAIAKELGIHAIVHNFSRSIASRRGCLLTAIQFRLNKLNLSKFDIFSFNDQNNRT